MLRSSIIRTSPVKVKLQKLELITYQRPIINSRQISIGIWSELQTSARVGEFSRQFFVIFRELQIVICVLIINLRLKKFKAKRSKVKAKQKVVQNSLPWLYQYWLEIASLLHKLVLVQASNFPVLHNPIHFLLLLGPHIAHKQNQSRLEITVYIRTVSSYLVLTWRKKVTFIAINGRNQDYS